MQQAFALNKLKTTRVPIALHNEVMRCLRAYLAKAALFFKTEYQTPEIIYRNKNSIAGSAYLTLWQIQLNLPMLLENKTDFINEVIPHELAHLITYKEFGRVKPHGKEWQAVMETVFGCKANRTHQFSIPNADLKQRFLYKCACQDHYLTAIRHNKIQQNKTQYQCKKCAEKLKFVTDK